MQISFCEQRVGDSSLLSPTPQQQKNERPHDEAAVTPVEHEYPRRRPSSVACGVPPSTHNNNNLLIQQLHVRHLRFQPTINPSKSFHKPTPASMMSASNEHFFRSSFESARKENTPSIFRRTNTASFLSEQAEEIALRLDSATTREVGKRAHGEESKSKLWPPHCSSATGETGDDHASMVLLVASLEECDSFEELVQVPILQVHDAMDACALMPTAKRRKGMLPPSCATTGAGCQGCLVLMNQITVRCSWCRNRFESPTLYEI